MNNAALILTPTVLAVIRAAAWAAWLSLRGFGMEVRDLQQEFAVHLLRRFEHYDERRSSPATFASHSCRQRTLQLLERLTAKKRNSASIAQSLSAPVDTKGGRQFELADTIADDPCAIRLGQRSRLAAELIELRIDVQRVFKTLPAELADVAERLMKGDGPAEISASLEISRATVYRRIAQLRICLRRAGLEKYTILREVA